MINVTKTYLPPIEEYSSYLQQIWNSHQLTNHGSLFLRLSHDLKEYLDVERILPVANGTIALQIAIKALKLQGDIITTPFSYVATTSSIVWEGCRPIFVDIHPKTLTINPDLIEKAITPHTSAILATHVYGYPCDVQRIQQISDQYHLKVIYDAAHAFGVRYQGTSLLNFGDISTLSFHATKLFHTGEGGAIVTKNDELTRRILYMFNFGHKGDESIEEIGINGKMSELHAAMGLCVLPQVPQLIAKRKTVSDLYDHLLIGSNLIRPECPENTEYNYAYYPVLFNSEKTLLNIKTALNNQGIYPRRYFYPPLNKLPYIATVKMPIAEDVSQRILCLPLSHYLLEDDVESICKIILNNS